jgi:hypothetical protein
MWKLEDGPSVATEKYSIIRFKRAYSKKQLGHVGFKAMVNGLYNMIEKDGLKDPSQTNLLLTFLIKTASSIT